VIRFRYPQICRWFGHKWGKPHGPPLSGWAERQTCRFCGWVRPYKEKPQ
jgi:hypothetical protein